MWVFDKLPVPCDPDLPARSRGPGLARARRRVRVAVVHARLSAGRRARQRRRHRRRGRQPLPRLHRRHRRHRDRATAIPQVVAAIKDQADKLLHMSGTDFYYQPQIDLAQRLAEAAPGPSPKRVFFTNSGAEALEAALKLARWHTGRSRVIAFLGAFHGRTYGAMSLSGSKLVHRRGFSPLVPDIHHVPFPRGCHERVPGRSRCQVIREIETLMQRVAPPDEVAAIFVEPIQGEGGYHVAAGLLPARLRDLCDEHGMLLVADEVQCGMGRTGKMFAVEHWGVEPDIVCLAKGIASGMPLGAIIARDTVMDWPSGSHASTFGGNPVSCRAALATLDLLEGDYMANAAARGEQLHRGLAQLCDATTIVLRNPRGSGLMGAVDVVDPKPAWAITIGATRWFRPHFTSGLLLLGCGECGIRFCPPLCIIGRAESIRRWTFWTSVAASPAESGRLRHRSRSISPKCTRGPTLSCRYAMASLGDRTSCPAFPVVLDHRGRREYPCRKFQGRTGVTDSWLSMREDAHAPAHGHRRLRLHRQQLHPPPARTPTRRVEVINFDALTYAGNLANLADLAGDTRYRSSGATSPTATPCAGSSSRASAASSTSRPRATSIAASRIPARSSAPTSSARRSCSTPPRNSACRGTCRFPPTKSTAASGRPGRSPRKRRWRPNSPYAASKAAADLLVRAYVHTFGMPAVITRCSNNYGPYQFPEKLIPLFVSNLLADKQVPVYGDGQQVRDWIHVRDHCRAVELVWRNGKAGEVYNIGGRCEKPTSN